MAKILVVDDEKNVVDLFSNILSKEGFKVLAATNGSDCLSLAEKELPDLVLLDVLMPEMDGGTIAYNLLINEKTKNIPIIFLTSIITEEEESRIIQGRLFISKFSSMEDIIKKIKGVLGIKA